MSIKELYRISPFGSFAMLCTGCIYSAVLTLASVNTHKAAMKGIIKAFASAASFKEEAADADFIVVADDLSGATSYITPEVSAVSTIAIGAAFA